MGCDIHAYIEVKADGQWKYYNWRRKHNYGEHQSHLDWERMTNDPLHILRHYALFAALAGVRNNFNTIPVSKPRGLPSNITKPVKAISDDWNSDGHTHSWLTLSEMQNYDFKSAGVYDGWTKTLDAMAELVDDPGNLRLVFFFDC